ncbi:hypothetical protein C8R44DRAFT_864970 [Mycena epipterygia]|nr:hypothetical protein C8R44DRAFT_864970 [Mycena epipterygia]
MYSSLKILHFKSTTFESVTAFIDVLHNCRVETFEIQSFDESLTKDEPKRLHSGFAPHFNHLSLRTIGIEGGGWIAEYGEKSHPIAGDVLSIMFCFINLVSFSIHHPLGFDLTNADIFDLTCSCPRIEHLSLRGNGCYIASISPGVTVYDLYAFAQHCPNLVSLGLTFHTTGISEWDPALERGLPKQAETDRCCRLSNYNLRRWQDGCLPRCGVSFCGH